MLSQQRKPCTDCKSPNSAQLQGTHYHSPTYTRVVGAVVCECGEGQTDTQTAVTTVHFASSTTHAKCNNGAKLSGITTPATSILGSVIISRLRFGIQSARNGSLSTELWNFKRFVAKMHQKSIAAAPCRFRRRSHTQA